jgi:hypothetical protein
MQSPLRIWSLIAALIVLHIAPFGFYTAAATPDNLLLNASFETGSTMPDHWTISPWGNAENFHWDATIRRSGQRSIRIDSTTPIDTFWEQRVTVEPFTEYRLSGYIRTRGVARQPDGIGAGANLSLSGKWERTDGIFGDQDWTFVSLYYTTGDEDELFIAARLGHWYGDTIGTAWFDDLRLERWHRPTKELANPGFEEGTAELSAWRPRLIQGEASFVWDTDHVLTGTRSAHVNVTGMGIASWEQTIVLEPDSEYEVSGWIRTERIVDPDNQWWTTGGRISIYGQDSYLGAASPGIRESEWTYTRFRFMSGMTTRATIACGIGSTDQLYAYDKSSGSIWCDDLKLERLRGLERRNYQGVHTGLNIYTEDDIFTSPQRYLALLDQVYLDMAELVGTTPYDDERIIVRSDASMNYGLLAGNPIRIGPGRTWADIVNMNGIDFGVPHELGHDFDIDPAASHYIGHLPSHNPEHWANFKVLYAFEMLGERHPELTVDCFGAIISIRDIGQCFEENARRQWFSRSDRDYTELSTDFYTGMLYGLREDIGWEPFKCTFRQYHQRGYPQRQRGDLEILQDWVNTLSRCAGKDVAPYYQAWGIPVTNGLKLYLPLLQ